MSIRTVLVEERDKFLEVKARLSALLERQITEFRYYFPFGRPEGALKQTLGLLERVSFSIFVIQLYPSCKIKLFLSSPLFIDNTCEK